MRAFVSAALEGMGSLGGSLAAAKADVMAAVDAAEKAGGGELDPSNEKGWQVGGGAGWGAPERGAPGGACGTRGGQAPLMPPCCKGAPLECSEGGAW